MEQGIPIIAVRDNKNRMQNDLTHLPCGRGKLIVVDNYLEVTGVMAALKAGVSLESVRCPLADTALISEVGETSESGTTVPCERVEGEK
jgi:hypothetical protein